MKYDITQHSKQANIVRNNKLTPKERSSIASKAAKARWANHHKCTDDCYCHCGRTKANHQGLQHKFKCNLKKNI